MRTWIHVQHAQSGALRDKGLEPFQLRGRNVEKGEISDMLKGIDWNVVNPILFWMSII